MEKSVILIVEDEVLIRMSAVQLLEDVGYTVLEARNADDAMWILDSRSDIRVVFTDIDMPGSLDGLKLAHAIRHRWPPIHLIVTSGMRVPTEEEFPRIARFISKPYGPKHVLKALSELFGPDPAPYRCSNNPTNYSGKVA